MNKSMLLSLTLCLCASSSATPLPAAMVADVTGKVTVAHAQAALLTEITNGGEVSVPAGASLTLAFFKDGHRVAITGPCTLTVQAGGLSLRSGTESQLHTISAPRQAAAGALRPMGSRMGAELVRNVGPDPFKVKTAGGQLTPRPTLEWTELTRTDKYRVTVTEEAGLTPILEVIVIGTRLPYPAEAPPLKPDRTYVVKVSGDGETRSAELTYVPPEELARLEGLAAGGGSDLSARLLLASQYLADGFYDRALPLALGVAQERPDDAGSHQLLALIYARLDQPEKASSEKQRAESLRH